MGRGESLLLKNAELPLPPTPPQQIKREQISCSIDKTCNSGGPTTAKPNGRVERQIQAGRQAGRVSCP